MVKMIYLFVVASQTHRLRSLVLGSLRYGCILICPLIFGLSCFDCPPQKLSTPSTEVRSGDQVRLHITLEGKFLGSVSEGVTHDQCQGFWYVDGYLHGNDRLGTIDRCGVYQAPLDLNQSRRIRISVSPYLLGIDPDETKICKDQCVACLDCCPIAEASITVVGN